MAYNPAIVREAFKILSERREKSKEEAEKRKEEIRVKLPAYAELKRETLRLMGEYMKNLGNNSFDFEKIKEELRKNAEEKERLLIKNGYPADYAEGKYFCEKCSDTGYIAHEKCECLKKLLREKAAEMSNLNGCAEGHSFAEFDYSLFSDVRNDDGISPRSNIKGILKKVATFIKEFDNKSTKSLLFMGKAGVGKTFLAECIAKELLERDFDVFYQSAGKITEITEDYKFRRNSDENISFDIARLYDTDLLIIDDLGCEFVTAYTISALYEIINRRLATGKKMIVTTNFSLKELNEVYAERLFSRFVGEFEILEFIGEDLRIKKIM